MIPIIEVGHGGIENGEYVTAPSKMYIYPDGFEIYEGVINRIIGQKLLSLLDSNEMPYIDLNVYSTKDEPLRDRSERINKLCEELPNAYLLSLHSNSASAKNKGKGTTAHGFEIFHFDGSGMSKTLANKSAYQYKKHFPDIKFRGVKTANFHMLRETECPAILIENLFFDNRKEAEFLASSEGQWRIAQCLYEIIYVNYTP